MANDPKQKYTPWRKAFWILFLAIVVTLLASLVALILHSAHSAH
jgi:hypothetical protein